MAVWSSCLLALLTIPLYADQLEMKNGDRYAGKILAVTSNSVILQSDMLGKVTLPRSNVSSLSFGVATGTNTFRAASNTLAAAQRPPIASPTNTDLAAQLHNLGANTNFIQQVRSQMLTGADPAASQKYDELVGGLLSGKLDVNDIRKEAQSSIDKIHELKRELGPDAGSSLDSYLEILQNFVNETAPASPPASFGTNSPPAHQNN